MSNREIKFWWGALSAISLVVIVGLVVMAVVTYKTFGTWQAVPSALAFAALLEFYVYLRRECALLWQKIINP